MTTKDNIEKILKERFKITYLEIIDDSDHHAGHAEAKKSGGGHFQVLMVSNDFAGHSSVQRHRMVYQALKEQMGSDIHALAIKAITENESLHTDS